MKERPIPFRPDMMTAIRADLKTQTRRLVKPAPLDMVRFIGADNKPTWEYGWGSHERVISKHITCPYGKPGDRLWCRESWWVAERHGQGIGNQFAIFDDEWLEGPPRLPDESAPLRSIFGKKWGHRPAMFMARAHARTLLEITDVRVERLQDISEEDAWAEGVSDCMGPLDIDGRVLFKSLWEQIHGTESWDANPWLWVISFKRDIPKTARTEPTIASREVGK